MLKPLKKVYLLVGVSDGASDALRAFRTPQALNDCIDRCLAHGAKRPRYPDHVEDTPENDAAFDLAEKKMERWRRRHPGGAGAWVHDSFVARVLRLQE
jgi:hypothetical protein